MRQVCNGDEFLFARESAKYITSLRPRDLQGLLRASKLGMSNSTNMLEVAVADITGGVVVNYDAYDVETDQEDFECKTAIPRYHGTYNDAFDALLKVKGKTGTIIAQVMYPQNVFHYYRIPYDSYCHIKSDLELPFRRSSKKWDKYKVGNSLLDCF